MFELHIDQRDRIVQQGSVPVRWCVSRDILEKLSAAGVTDPYVLLITAPVANYHEKREERKVVPLRDCMAFVEFRTPGENRIFAALVGPCEDQHPKDLYLRMVGARWQTTALNHKGDELRVEREYGESQNRPLLLGPEARTSLTVEVPAAVFAKEPPPWLQWWLTLFLKDDYSDSCGFRKLLLFSIFLQPFLCVLALLVKIAFMCTFGLIVLSLGMYSGMRWRNFFSPLVIDPLNYLDERRAQALFVKEKTGYVSWYLIPFSPLILTIVFWVFSRSGISTGTNVLLSLALSGLCSAILFAATEWGYRRKIALSNRASTSQPTPVWYLNPKELDILSCALPSTRVAVSTLPMSHRTIRLYFNDLKARVCRPRAR